MGFLPAAAASRRTAVLALARRATSGAGHGHPVQDHPYNPEFLTPETLPHHDARPQLAGSRGCFPTFFEPSRCGRPGDARDGKGSPTPRHPLSGRKRPPPANLGAVGRFWNAIREAWAARDAHPVNPWRRLARKRSAVIPRPAGRPGAAPGARPSPRDPLLASRGEARPFSRPHEIRGSWGSGPV